MTGKVTNVPLPTSSVSVTWADGRRRGISRSLGYEAKTGGSKTVGVTDSRGSLSRNQVRMTLAVTTKRLGMNFNLGAARAWTPDARAHIGNLIIGPLRCVPRPATGNW